MRDNSAEIIFHSFLQEVLVSSTGKGRAVHSWMLSFQCVFGGLGRKLAFPKPVLSKEASLSPTDQRDQNNNLYQTILSEKAH